MNMSALFSRLSTAIVATVVIFFVYINFQDLFYNSFYYFSTNNRIVVVLIGNVFAFSLSFFLGNRKNEKFIKFSSVRSMEQGALINYNKIRIKLGSFFITIFSLILIIIFNFFDSNKYDFIAYSIMIFTLFSVINAYIGRLSVYAASIFMLSLFTVSASIDSIDPIVVFCSIVWVSKYTDVCMYISENIKSKPSFFSGASGEQLVSPFDPFLRTIEKLRNNRISGIGFAIASFIIFLFEITFMSEDIKDMLLKNSYIFQTFRFWEQAYGVDRIHGLIFSLSVITLIVLSATAGRRREIIEYIKSREGLNPVRKFFSIPYATAILTHLYFKEFLRKLISIGLSSFVLTMVFYAFIVIYNNFWQSLLFLVKNLTISYKNYLKIPTFVMSNYFPLMVELTIYFSAILLMCTFIWFSLIELILSMIFKNERYIDVKYGILAGFGKLGKGIILVIWAPLSRINIAMADAAPLISLQVIVGCFMSELILVCYHSIVPESRYYVGAGYIITSVIVIVSSIFLLKELPFIKRGKLFSGDSGGKSDKITQSKSPEDTV